MLKPDKFGSMPAPMIEPEKTVAAAVLFGSHPGRGPLAALLRALGDPGTLKVDEEDGQITVHRGSTRIDAQLFDTPVPDNEAEKNLHPQIGMDGLPQQQVAHALIEATTNRTAHEGQLSPREAQLQRVQAHATIINALAKMPECIGVYFGTSGTTFPAPYVAHMLGGDAHLASVYAPISFTQAQGGYSGYSCGLRSFGHLEIQAHNMRAEPRDVWTYLMDTADEILRGASIRAGQIEGRSADTYLHAKYEPWIKDPRYPAVQIHM